MHLYDCRLDVFIPQATSGQIADVLRSRFIQRMDMRPSDSEVKSWRNSLGAFADAVSQVGMEESWIVLEYQLPLSSSRIDCMLLGTDNHKAKNAVLLEFKQWDRCAPSHIPEVVSIGGTDLLHPCAQVRDYRQYLQDAHTAFVDGDVRMSSCAYLHNVSHNATSGFFAPVYSELLEDSPAFTMETVENLGRFVGDRVYHGAEPVFVQSVLEGHYRPSRKLLDYVANAISGYEPWTLLDEQRVVFNKILADIDDGKRKGEKRVIIVTGGPGTGKSVIAVQVVGAAAKRYYSVVHATGSKAFTTNLRGIVGRRETFRYFNTFGKQPQNSIDLIVSDEAHRLRETSASFYHPGSDRPQVGEIVDAGLVSVFLLDHAQSVRSNEVGSVPLIEAYARDHSIPVSLYDLRTQFRCAGSDSYIRWVEYVLGLSPNRSMAWKTNDEYEVQVFDRVEQMELALQDRITEGASARMVAGFCWPWSDPNLNVSLVPDVKIGAWSRPWNRKPRDMWRNKGNAEPPERHPYKIWATQPQGFGEVGCIYSAQGFEFDYVGVIFGGDLKWDAMSNCWSLDLTRNEDVGFKHGLTRDSAKAIEKLKHIYRVLSTRGMRGTYFYFLDDATRRHFEQMMAT
jgi:hypothetical protein